MHAQRIIKAREGIQDIRSRMTASDLMRKYGLSPLQMERILHQLEKLMVNPADLYPRSWSRKTRESLETTRSRVRLEVPFHVLVRDPKTPDAVGVLRDISEEGLRVAGMETPVHQERSLVICLDEALQMSPIEFDASCCWVSRKGFNLATMAGFEILRISRGNLKNLKALIRAVESEKTFGRVTSRLDRGNSGETGVAKSEIMRRCPACGMPQFKEFDECPQCGVIVSKFLSQLERVVTDVHDVRQAPR